jgi:hypothetical protein
MLTVWCVLNGDKYQPEDAHILKNMVSANLEQEHRFMCLSDRYIEGINTVVPDEQWPGWWAKLQLFRVATGQCLYLDLDTVIVGNLDRLVSKQLSMPANWAQSGHGGCQSSVMSWGEDYSFIAEAFDPDLLGEPVNGNCGPYGKHRLWGDQEFISDVMGDPGEVVIPMPHIYSYKYHARNGCPEDASVICFHGEPKPGQVQDEWVRQARSYTAIAV